MNQSNISQEFENVIKNTELLYQKRKVEIKNKIKLNQFLYEEKIKKLTNKYLAKFNNELFKTISKIHFNYDYEDIYENCKYNEEFDEGYISKSFIFYDFEINDFEDNWDNFFHHQSYNYYYNIYIDNVKIFLKELQDKCLIPSQLILNKKDDIFIYKTIDSNKFALKVTWN